MTLKARYARAMEGLYLACVALSGLALVAITLMIPAGVFMRYVMHSPMSWPEPAAVVLMVMFSFIGGAAVYRANVHIAVEALLNAVNLKTKKIMLWAVDLCMTSMALFMLGYGTHLCQITWQNTVPEFPGMSVGLVYMPIPIAGLLTLLFIIEKVCVGPPPKSSIMYSDQAAELE